MKEKASGKVKLGIQCFADALLVIPRTLAENSGFDAQETLLKVMEAHEKSGEQYLLTGLAPMTIRETKQVTRF